MQHRGTVKKTATQNLAPSVLDVSKGTVDVNCSKNANSVIRNELNLRRSDRPVERTDALRGTEKLPFRVASLLAHKRLHPATKLCF